MRNSKYVTFMNSLVNVVSNLDRDAVKSSIGDSVNNHRTLTVNQIIRYLRGTSNTKLRGLANKLERVYNLLRDSVIQDRNLRGLSRTDSIDINEFITTYASDVIYGPTSARRSIGQILGNY